MSDHHDIYLKTDVLLLTDVVEKFIDIFLEYYRLDPCRQFSSAALIWDELLQMTEIELELISDTEMYLFVKKGMREGISYISKRFSKANNKYMKSYKRNKPSKYIMYLVGNNLYDSAMSHHLPYDKFKWLNQKEINKFYLHSIGENSSIGYISEIHLEYPDELYELHNGYPLAPKKLEISHNMLPNDCSNIANKYDIKIDRANKLIPNLGNKCKYVLPYGNLQLYLSLRMKLTKVHRILKFKQFHWLKKYIDFNTGKRKNAANIFENFFSKN